MTTRTSVVGVDGSNDSRKEQVVFNRIIVPTDGSDYSWRAVTVGAALAQQCDAPLELLEVVTYPPDVKRAEQLISERLARTPLSTPATACARVMQRSVGSTIADHVYNVNGGIIVMSTFGRGRTEAILGSVAVDVLREMFGPLIVVGPRARTDRTDLRGELIVPVDGSDFSETTLSLGAAWGIDLEARPWVVEVLEPDQVRVPDTTESSYAARLARDIRRVSHHDAQYEVLHNRHPGKAIADFARSIGASLIVASTHGTHGAGPPDARERGDGDRASRTVPGRPDPTADAVQGVASERQDVRHCERLTKARSFGRVRRRTTGRRRHPGRAAVSSDRRSRPSSMARSWMRRSRLALFVVRETDEIDEMVVVVFVAFDPGACDGRELGRAVDLIDVDEPGPFEQLVGGEDGRRPRRGHRGGRGAAGWGSVPARDGW